MVYILRREVGLKNTHLWGGKYRNFQRKKERLERRLKFKQRLEKVKSIKNKLKQLLEVKSIKNRLKL